MPRGGRRFGKSAAEHKLAGTFRRDRHTGRDSPSLPPARPPPPPPHLTAAEREAWAEVRREVVALGTYTRADLSAFKLAVRGLALVYSAPADMKATSLRSLLLAASQLLARFGCDPVARRQVTVAVPAPEPTGEDTLAEFEAPTYPAPQSRGARA